MTTKFHGGPADGKLLMIRRAPPFLRVVVNPKGVLDALDQLGDRPDYTEAIHAYRRTVKRGDVHLYFGGGKGGWFQIAEYEYIQEQPPESVLRYTTRWRQWCEGQVKKGTYIVNSSGM